MRLCLSAWLEGAGTTRPPKSHAELFESSWRLAPGWFRAGWLWDFHSEGEVCEVLTTRFLQRRRSRLSSCRGRWGAEGHLAALSHFLLVLLDFGVEGTVRSAEDAELQCREPQAYARGRSGFHGNSSAA